MEINNDNYAQALDECYKTGKSLRDLDVTIKFDVNGSIFVYRPEERYLSNLFGSNVAIFKALGLDEVNFCEKIYGHTPSDGSFPESRKFHKDCVYNITRALFNECIGINKNVEKIPLTSISTDFITEMPKKQAVESFKNVIKRIEAEQRAAPRYMMHPDIPF